MYVIYLNSLIPPIGTSSLLLLTYIIASYSFSSSHQRGETPAPSPPLDFMQTEEETIVIDRGNEVVVEKEVVKERERSAEYIVTSVGKLVASPSL